MKCMDDDECSAEDATGMGPQNCVTDATATRVSLNQDCPHVIIEKFV